MAVSRVSLQAKLYIQTNNDWDHENKFKYGITQDPYNRLNTDQHSYKTLYKSIYEYTITKQYKLKFKQVDKIISIIGRQKNKIEQLKNHYNNDFIFLSEINKYLVNNGGGTEFIYKDGLEILEQILLFEFNILGIEIKKINIDELQKINDNITIFYNEINDFDFDFKINDEIINNEIKINKYNLRDYQTQIINKSVELLIQNKKLYLELATGAGKTVIAYSIFNNINPKTIIILTPRINICEQNISDKYKQILSNKDYNFYTKDYKINNINNKNYNILCYCIQSFKKVHTIIKSKNLTDILIWFDEAHWGIDGWAENSNFLLLDNQYIKYRLFTSASPDRDFINRNRHVYGELYTPIKVSELMKEKWLCGIQVHIYEDIVEDVNNISLINFTIQKFNELNKNLGMNFNKDCNTATDRFMVHYKLYIDNKTDIKPFLLLNDEYISKLSIDIDFTDINVFNVSTNAIGYVVAKYSMGYDNKNIDMLIFSDPKLSSKDIIQSIGRGTRPDQKASEGKNESKINDIILPVAINEYDDAETYDKIKEVIKYLLIDLELDPYDRFTFINKNKKSNSNNSYDFKEEDDCEVKNIKSIVYNIYTNNYNWTIQQITRHLLNNNIHNYKDYLKYKNDNQYLNLAEELFRTFPKFDFYNTYKLNSCPYYNKEECIKAIEKYSRDLIYEDDIIDNTDKIIFLNNKDNKIPNECLWYFYGGNSKDFLIF
jgi:superfamily II DNA or RNA helicase